MIVSCLQFDEVNPEEIDGGLTVKHLIAFTTNEGVGNDPVALHESLKAGLAVTFYSMETSSFLLPLLRTHGVENWQDYSQPTWVFDNPEDGGGSLLRYVGGHEGCCLPDLMHIQFSLVDDPHQTGRDYRAWWVRKLLLTCHGVQAAFNDIGQRICNIAGNLGADSLNPLGVQPSMLDAALALNAGLPLVDDGSGFSFLFDVCWRPIHTGMSHMPRFYLLRTTDTQEGQADYFAGEADLTSAHVAGLTRPVTYDTLHGPRSTFLPFLIGCTPCLVN
jgi:hypothetical protein